MKIDMLVGNVLSYSPKPTDRSKLGPVTVEVSLTTQPHIGDIVLASRQDEFAAWASRLKCNEIVTVEFSDSVPVPGATVVKDDESFVPPLARVAHRTPGN